MNRELQRRLRAAGAPICPCLRTSVWVELAGDKHTGAGEPRQLQREAFEPGPYQDALIITALKLDCHSRGLRSRTANEPGQPQHRVWLFTHDGNPVGTGEHPDSEATAWGLAWLQAFEQPEGEQ